MYIEKVASTTMKRTPEFNPQTELRSLLAASTQPEIVKGVKNVDRSGLQSKAADELPNESIPEATAPAESQQVLLERLQSAYGINTTSEVNDAPARPKRAVSRSSEGEVAVDTPDSLFNTIRAKALARHEAKGNAAIDDLVNFDDNFAAHHEKNTSGRRAGAFMGNEDLRGIATWQDEIRDGLEERQRENELKRQSDAFRPALAGIEQALAAHADKITDDLTSISEIGLIRAELVKSGVATSLEVGKMTDAYIQQMLAYAGPSQKTMIQSIEPTHPDAPASAAIIGNQAPPTSPDAPASPAVVGKIMAPTSPNAPASPAVVGTTPAPTSPDAPASAAVVGNVIAQSPELQAKLAELDAARAEWASVSTRRHNRTFDRRIEGYNATKEKYMLLVQELGRIQTHDEVAAANDQTSKNAIAVAYYAAEQNKLREITKHESDARFVNKFSNFMNRGSRKARIAKGIVLGLVVGTGGSVALGAAGAIGAAGLAVGASRFVRGYTMRNKAGVGQLDERQVQAARASANLQADDADRFEHLSSVFRDFFETDSKKEQSKRRKAFGAGAISVAVGAVAGHALHAGIDYFQGGSPDTAAAVADKTVDAEVVDKTPPLAPKGPDLHELASARDAYTIHSGEGWYETFKDMGIPEDKWSEVLNDAGPQLHEQGLSYFDGATNEWRVSQPGQLPEGAVQVLKDASAKNGFSFR